MLKSEIRETDKSVVFSTEAQKLRPASVYKVKAGIFQKHQYLRSALNTHNQYMSPFTLRGRGAGFAFPPPNPRSKSSIANFQGEEWTHCVGDLSRAYNWAE